MRQVLRQGTRRTAQRRARALKGDESGSVLDGMITTGCAEQQNPSWSMVVRGGPAQLLGKALQLHQVQEALLDRSLEVQGILRGACGPSAA